MNIDVTKTRRAYLDYTGKMEFLTKQVHEYVLVSGWLETHYKPVVKAISKIAERHDELLVPTFIGKLRHKLPQLRMGIKLNEFDKVRAQMIAAAVIVQILIDNESYPVDKRVDSIMVNGNKKFRTQLYILLGGSFTKNLLDGIEREPGVVNQSLVGGWKLKAIEKAFLRRVSSQAFRLSHVCSKELLMKGYSLKVDWGKKVDKNGKSLPEDPIMRTRRYKKYASVIMDQVAYMPAIYFPAKYCGRDRVYYEAAMLDGMRPHGKLWETLMIDAAVPFDLTEDDERVLKHIIYVTLHDRVSIDEANELFSLEDMLDAQSADPFEQDTEKGFGEAILLNKAYEALTDYANGNLSRFLFGYDFTNSGLLMAGVSFRSDKMMAAANVGGSDQVVDSHSSFGDAYGIDLDRKDIKGIHMGLMHGSALQSIADTIAETTGVSVTEKQVEVFNEQAYGKCVGNITRIAEWGTKVIGNEQSVLRWTMPDGFSACSRAYLKSVPVLVYCVSAAHKEGYTSYTIVSDMPWVEDKNGFPMYGKGTCIGGVFYDVKQKRRGLFANITHSIDAYMLRCVGNAVMDTGRPILFKHDDYIAPPSAYSVIQDTAKAVFSQMFVYNLYQFAIDEIIENSPYELDSFDLVDGGGKCMIMQSNNFLMP